MPSATQCLECKHYKIMGCEAFPDEIPYEILSGQHDHTEPYRGDNGIRFEPIKE